MRRRPARRRYISHNDLTALVDVAFLLLAFFLMSSRFKPAGVVEVDVPVRDARHFTCKIGDAPRMTIVANQAGAVFLNFHDPRLRAQVLAQAAKASDLPLTPQAVQAFSRTEDFGGPAHRLFARLLGERDDLFPLILEEGIPISKTNSELSDWLKWGLKADSRLVCQIRADGDVAYPAVDAVVATLQSAGVNQFELLTHLTRDPHLASR